MSVNLVVNPGLPPPSRVTVAFPRSRSAAVVTWEALPPFMGVAPRYTVSRAPSKAGVYAALTLSPVAGNRYEDAALDPNPNVDYWYTVAAVYESGGVAFSTPPSEPAHFQVSTMDRWFFKVNERNYWILKNTGQLFDLYQRKYSGERCPQCYDPVHGRATSPDCAVCYGTGFVGGYTPAFQLYVRLKPTSTVLNVGPQMYVNENSPGAWTITDVKIVNRDLLIGPTGTMYEVLSSHVNQAGGYLFHTELQLRALDPKDKLYGMRREVLYPRVPGVDVEGPAPFLSEEVTRSPQFRAFGRGPFFEWQTPI